MELPAETEDFICHTTFVLILFILTTKVCSKCKTPKSFDDFHLRVNSKDGHVDRCKLCAIATAHDWYTKNSVEVNKKRQDDRMNDGEAIRAKEREDYKGKRGIQKRAAAKRFKLKYPDRVKATHQRWYKQAHAREEFRLAQHARSMMARAKRCGSRIIEYFTILEIAERDGWICHICNGKVTRKNWSVDHIIPLVQKGPHTRAFVRLAHRRCNQRRSYGLFPAQFPLFP